MLGRLFCSSFHRDQQYDLRHGRFLFELCRPLPGLNPGPAFGASVTAVTGFRLAAIQHRGRVGRRGDHRGGFPAFVHLRGAPSLGAVRASVREDAGQVRRRSSAICRGGRTPNCRLVLVFSASSTPFTWPVVDECAGGSPPSRGAGFRSPVDDRVPVLAFNGRARVLGPGAGRARGFFFRFSRQAPPQKTHRPPPCPPHPPRRRAKAPKRGFFPAGSFFFRLFSPPASGAPSAGPRRRALSRRGFPLAGLGPFFFPC